MLGRYCLADTDIDESGDDPRLQGGRNGRYIGRFVTGEIGIGRDIADRLGRPFRTVPQFRMKLQRHPELERAAGAMGPAIDEAVRFEIKTAA